MSSLKIYVKPAPGERVETELTLPEAQESSIFGAVRLPSGDLTSFCILFIKRELFQW